MKLPKVSLLRIVVLYVFLLIVVGVSAQDDYKKYIPIIRNHIYDNYKGMFKDAGGALKYPFVTPGSDQYSDVLWDWDSWLTNVAIRQILLENSSKEERDSLYKYEQGCILNFLNYGGMNGWIPFRITRNSVNREEWMTQVIAKHGSLYNTNMHKPCLAQHAAFLVQQNNGDAEWLRESFYFLQAFVNGYSNHYKHRVTGLYFWADAAGIGVDNDPSTYFRPSKSSGSILLNTFMYKELLAMEYLANELGLEEIAVIYQREAKALKANIQKHCWDSRDKFYYSVDLNLNAYEQPKEWWEIHSGGPAKYSCLIQRIDIWSGFLAMWSGVATETQARNIVDLHFHDKGRFNAPYGIRTLSPLEKMYDPRASGNPSSWLGPIWGVSNYLVFRGMVGYGYLDEAEEIVKKTILLFGRDIEKTGAMHEYYLPDNGMPVLNKGFQNWNYLVLNMIAWLEGNEVASEF